MIDNRETWITFLVTKLRHHMLWHPTDFFTAEGFVERLSQELRPADARWSGLAFQRAKREGIITETVGIVDRTEFLVKMPTRAGHYTTVWSQA